MSELRFHPFLDTWVITATHRQDRTFFPPPDYNPLAPTKPGGFPTEIPFENYDIVVFENKFPSLQTPPAESSIEGSDLYAVRPSDGVCEVVCYTPDPNASLAALPIAQIRKLTRVWRDRYIDLSSRSEVEYVFIFENKGKEIGVTLSHPHGQIYAYPFIPPILREELLAERSHFERTGRLLMADVLAEEGLVPVPDGEGGWDCVANLGVGEIALDTPITFHLNDAPRIVCENATFVAFVPFFARYPYELYVTSKCHRSSLAAFSDSELDDLASILMDVTGRYDRLFGFSLPYIMAMHQRPAKGDYDWNWFHIEFYPPHRTESKLKFLAGSEAGAGAFINDTLPEVTAKTLREI
jgi:UDPglucose--hexose-1-phosphate uridylyltransferase